MLGEKARRSFNAENDDRRENFIPQQTVAFLIILKEITQPRYFCSAMKNVIHNSFFPVHH